jgi:hypothetical protein
MLVTELKERFLEDFMNVKAKSGHKTEQFAAEATVQPLTTTRQNG